MSEQHWRSIKEWRRSTEMDGAEFAETPIGIDAGPDRRGFLRAAGFSFGAGMLAGCARTVQKIEPNLQQPAGFVPGRSVYYASVCAGCSAGCGTLVKVRDGRPIKLEGNCDHPVSRGGLCAAGQAWILGLYDKERIAQPALEGKPVDEGTLDAFVSGRLEEARRAGSAVRLLTGTIHSPTESAWIRQFLTRFPNARHIEYDALSCSAILDAHHVTHGARILPRYRFDKADVIVGIDADFLGTWISPVEFTRAYSASRNPGGSHYAWHAQVEARMSLTGTKADRRAIVRADELADFVAALYDAIVGGKPAGRPDVAEIAQRLRDARGRGLVVCGLQDVASQVRCNRINDVLGNYGSTLETDRASRQRRGSDGAVEDLLGELRGGAVDVLIVAGANPAFELPGGDAVTKARLLIVHAERMDETADKAHAISAAPHALESWTDAEPVEGTVSIGQPCIRPLFRTRPLVEALAAWCGRPDSALHLIREHWLSEIFPKSAARAAGFERFWERSLQDGFATYEPGVKERATVKRPDPPVVQRNLQSSGFTLVCYPKPAMLEGRHAYNPWLQEVPDPITKVAWDNYACLAPAAAARLGVSTGDIVRLKCGGEEIELPALIQPGQNENTVAVALGYGSRLSRRFANVGPQWLESRPTLNERGLVGVNIAPLLQFQAATLQYVRSGVVVSKTGKAAALACTQEHHTLSVPPRLAPAAGATRPIVQETTLVDIRQAGNSPAHEENRPELWPPDHPYPVHHWAMTIDLNACTGCSACIVACQAENNIPVVGKDEMRRKREMHWMRIDRYYSGAPDNPRVAHQPMFCQQCEHAPCETVCPVLATAHSDEGLNQQVYNRCVGTRYCANNCPYKVRRFNWFNYAREDRLANLVLNPDVTVRSRGVMEKCTFCVQRIQEAKIEAKRLGEPVRDGDIQTACQQTCPAKAIVFGDLKDPKSDVSRLMASGRRYRVLEEINVRPAVGYLKIVRSAEEKENG